MVTNIPRFLHPSYLTSEKRQRYQPTAHPRKQRFLATAFQGGPVANGKAFWDLACLKGENILNNQKALYSSKSSWQQQCYLQDNSCPSLNNEEITIIIKNYYYALKYIKCKQCAKIKNNYFEQFSEFDPNRPPLTIRLKYEVGNDSHDQANLLIKAGLWISGMISASLYLSRTWNRSSHGGPYALCLIFQP